MNLFSPKQERFLVVTYKDVILILEYNDLSQSILSLFIPLYTPITLAHKIHGKQKKLPI